MCAWDFSRSASTAFVRSFVKIGVARTLYVSSVSGLPAGQVFFFSSLVGLAIQMRMEHHIVPGDIFHIITFLICAILFVVLLWMTRYIGAFDVTVTSSLYDGKNMIPLVLMMSTLAMTMYGVSIAFVDYKEENDLQYSQLVISEGLLLFFGTILLYWRGFLMSRAERTQRKVIDKRENFDDDDFDEDYSGHA